jgi:hypothetical protein
VKRLPACHPPFVFVWRPSPHEPFRAYPCARWFTPPVISWHGKDLGRAADVANRANAACGFQPARAEAAKERPEEDWRAAGKHLLRRLLWWRPAQVEPVRPRLASRLPRHSVEPLRRPLPEELIGLLSILDRHNAPPPAPLQEAGWVAAEGLTSAGTYALHRGMAEAPLPFLQSVFGDGADAARKDHVRMLETELAAGDPMATIRRPDAAAAVLLPRPEGGQPVSDVIARLRGR